MNPSETSGQQSPDLVLYGGKGGVGKTTCAAAHALARSIKPETTALVISTDPAHSLGDSLECDLSGEPTAVTDSLCALEVDAEAGQEAYRRVIEALAGEFRSAGLRLGDDDLERLFRAGLIPGGDEVAALEYFAQYAEAEYDCVVFDTAPTGHTLRLLDLPAVLSETLGVAGEVQQRVKRTATAARSMVFGPAAYWGAGDETDEVGSLRDRITMVGDLLRDPERTRFRVVLTPERMAIAEAERLVAQLDELSIPVDSLVANRVFENAEDCPCERCQRDAERHARRLREIDERFEHAVVSVPRLAGEAQGLDTLSEFGSSLFAGTQKR